MPPPQALMRPDNRTVEKAWVKEPNTGLKSRPRRPNRGRMHNRKIEKNYARKAKYWALMPLRKRNRGPIAVKWKKIPKKKNRILIIKAVPAGLDAAPYP